MTVIGLILLFNKLNKNDNKTFSFSTMTGPIQSITDNNIIKLKMSELTKPTL